MEGGERKITNFVSYTILYYLPIKCSATTQYSAQPGHSECSGRMPGERERAREIEGGRDREGEGEREREGEEERERDRCSISDT